MNKKKVLIITYYWPPSGGAGVQRWMKMSKYLSEFGWEPVIYTPENPEIPAEDQSLLKEVNAGTTVIKRKIWEPYNAYNKLFKKKSATHANYLSNSNKGFLQELAKWVRANLFIPDPRKYWVKPSVKFLKQYIKTNPVDAIISTGPPHSMHLIALGLKKSTNTPWIADFRDPWTFIDFFHQLPLSKTSLKKHQKLEELVIKEADQCVTVSPSWAFKFEELYNKPFQTIYNGFDTEDFKENKPVGRDTSFSICHIGSLNEDRNPDFLWKALKDLCEEIPSFSDQLEIKLIGKVTPLTITQITELGLSNNLTHIDYLPHADVIEETQKSQLLLLLINNTNNVSGIIPGKAYEYIAANRPIICIGDKKADAAKIINQTNSGSIVQFNDNKGFKDVIREYFDTFLTGEIKSHTINREKFNRRSQAKQFAQLLSSIS